MKIIMVKKFTDGVNDKYREGLNVPTLTKNIYASEEK